MNALLEWFAAAPFWFFLTGFVVLAAFILLSVESSRQARSRRRLIHGRGWPLTRRQAAVNAYVLALPALFGLRLDFFRARLDGSVMVLRTIWSLGSTPHPYLVADSEMMDFADARSAATLLRGLE